MRWVLITAFGVPVEPEVNRNFAMLSGPIRACAASNAAWQRSAPQADLRGTVEFKKHLAGVLVARGLRQALARLGVHA